MSRRSVNPGRRVSDGGLPTVAGLLHHKSRSPPVLTIALLVLGVIVLIAYFNTGSGVTVTSREIVSKSEGVYEEWMDCHQQVDKFSGNSYKGYATREEVVTKWRRHVWKKNQTKILVLLAVTVYYILS